MNLAESGGTSVPRIAELGRNRRCLFVLAHLLLIPVTFKVQRLINHHSVSCTHSSSLRLSLMTRLRLYFTKHRLYQRLISVNPTAKAATMGRPIVPRGISKHNSRYATLARSSRTRGVFNSTRGIKSALLQTEAEAGLSLLPEPQLSLYETPPSLSEPPPQLEAPEEIQDSQEIAKLRERVQLLEYAMLQNV
jgi:hypothetical protein